MGNERMEYKQSDMESSKLLQTEQETLKNVARLQDLKKEVYNNPDLIDQFVSEKIVLIENTLTLAEDRLQTESNEKKQDAEKAKKELKQLQSAISILCENSAYTEKCKSYTQQANDFQRRIDALVGPGYDDKHPDDDQEPNNPQGSSTKPSAGTGKGSAEGGEDYDEASVDFQDPENNSQFQAEKKNLDGQYPQLSQKEKDRIAGLSRSIMDNPDATALAMAQMQGKGNEHHREYLEKYYHLVQKYNEGEISKLKALNGAIKAEKKFNIQDLGTTREARQAAKTAAKELKYNKGREKYVKKLLRCALLAEASERRTKMMLDMTAVIKTANVGSNGLPDVQMNYGNAPYFPQTPGNSLLWTTLSGLGCTSLDQLPKDLFRGIDMRLFPELSTDATVPYRMQLEGYLNPELKKSARGKIENDSRINWNYESYPDNELMERFFLVVNSKGRYDKDHYPDGRRPLFAEVAKRYLTQNMNVPAYMQQAGRPEEKNKQMLEEVLFSLVDDQMVGEMRVLWKMVKFPVPEDDESLRHHLLGHIFAKALMKQEGYAPSNEERVKTQLAVAFGGGWTANEGFEGNEKLGRIIDAHVATLPKEPYGGQDHGGSEWLNKSLTTGDFFLQQDGSRGGINRTINMAITGGLTQLGVSPKNALAVTSAVKLFGGGLLAYVAIKGWYNNFWKGQSWGNVIRKNAALIGGLTILPRALFDRTAGELWEYAIRGDREGKGLVPGPLLKKFGRDIDLKTDTDDSEVPFETGIAFGPMTLGDMAKYIRQEGGKYYLEGEDLKNFLNSPDVPRESKEQISRLLSTCKGSERRLSNYLTQGLTRSGFDKDGNNFTKLTTTEPYMSKTFEELQRAHIEIHHTFNQFKDLIGDETTKSELTTRYAGLPEEEKVQAAERIGEVKEMQARRKNTTPYIQYLGYRDELFSGAPAGSVLEGITKDKTDALLAGIKNYNDKAGSLAKAYIMEPTGLPKYEEIFANEFGVAKDLAQKLYGPDGIKELRAYEKVVNSKDFLDRYAFDYTKEWVIGDRTRNNGAQKMNLHHGVLKNIPGANNDVFVSVEKNPLNPSASQLSLWLKNENSGLWEEFQREKIHDTPVDVLRLGMDLNGTPPGFFMKLPTAAGGTHNTQFPDKFGDAFFPGMIQKLQKGETDFRVPEDWLSEEQNAPTTTPNGPQPSAGTQPTWIWDKKNTGIWKVDPDVPSKLFGPKIIFKKTGKTMP